MVTLIGTDVLQESPVCLIFGTHLNAHTIIQRLSEIGILSQDICIVKPKGYPSFAAEIFNRSIQVWEIEIDTADELPEKIRERFGVTRTKILFFTDESNLSAFNAALINGAIPDMRLFVGSSKHLDTILDRLLFYKFVQERGLAHVPRTISGREDPFAKFGGQVVVRPRVSWSSPRNRQRVSIVSSPEALAKVLSVYRTAGLTPDDWCYQEVLSMDAVHNVSVCGWFDARHQHLFCTRKILQHPEPCGNGDVIEFLAEPPPYIIEQSNALLEALEYEGPFELEWVYDNSHRTYKIIELNPRFWMQHGLVDVISGGTVVRRYLGMDGVLTAEFPQLRSVRYWVNPLYGLLRMLQGDFRGMRFYFSRSSISPISLVQALVYAPFHFRGKRAL